MVIGKESSVRVFRPSVIFAQTYVGIRKDTKDEKKEGLEDSESCALRLFDMVDNIGRELRCTMI